MRIGDWGCAVALLAASLARPAQAAGGAHVVDDSEVETPGHCHLETWGSSYAGHGGLINASPACTPLAPGNIEIDTGAAHVWGDGAHDTFAGFGTKITLRPQSRGLGIGASGFLTFDTGARRLAFATFRVPVTIPVDSHLRVNVNVGAEWSRALDRWTMTGGVQGEYSIRPNLEWMAEALARSGQRRGWQTGPRWTVDKGRIDVDLLAARFSDGATRHAYTLGVTIRR